MGDKAESMKQQCDRQEADVQRLTRERDTAHNDCERMRQENEALRQKLEERESQWQLAKGERDLVDTLSLARLNELEKQLNKGLERLQDARMRIVSESRKCVAC